MVDTELSEALGNFNSALIQVRNGPPATDTRDLEAAMALWQTTASKITKMRPGPNRAEIQKQLIADIRELTETLTTARKLRAEATRLEAELSELKAQAQYLVELKASDPRAFAALQASTPTITDAEYGLWQERAMKIKGMAPGPERDEAQRQFMAELKALEQ